MGISANDVIFRGFDINELRNVARVLQATNPSIPKSQNTESVMHHIRDVVVANIKDGEATYIGTLGFIASGYYYCGDRADWRYKVSLSAWGIAKHLNIPTE